MADALNGKIAIVTGGSRGIGAAVATRLAKEGAIVCITFPDQSADPSAVLDVIRGNGGRALAVRADSGDPAEVRRAIASVADEHGRVDILVNNAGIIRVSPIAELSLSDFDLIFAINVRGAFVATQEAVKHMPSGGRVIMIGSCNADRIPFVGGSAYGMSKAAVAALSRGLARDLGARGITVNTVQPGPTDTDLNPADGATAEGQRIHLATGRYARPDEIAGMVAYLARDEAAFVTGATFTIDGGYNA